MNLNFYFHFEEKTTPQSVRFIFAAAHELNKKADFPMW